MVAWVRAAGKAAECEPLVAAPLAAATGPGPGTVVAGAGLTGLLDVDRLSLHRSPPPPGRGRRAWAWWWRRAGLLDMNFSPLAAATGPGYQW